MALEEAEAQLAELELLISMFPSEEEFVVSDQLAFAELRDYVEGVSTTPPHSRPDFVIKHKTDTVTTKGVDITISCTYVSDYPKVLPEISVRCAHLSRAQQTHLHNDLNLYLLENCSGEACLLSAFEWVKDNATQYIDKSLSAPVPKKDSTLVPTQETFTRLWIYSHHIYNKTKRKNILDWSKELNLSGFSMPGKPGVVCVEGLRTPCDEFWSRVKCLTWKRIMIRHREDISLDGQDGSIDESVASLRKFTGFDEAIFDPHGNRGNHMDLGQLYQFLSEKGCGEIFQLYFGIEGK
ncbi:RWD domain-containing protein 2B isoform X3 [Clupea harengus]|uniref:RWD domain-containing protein 2B isoform X3 n=1 Tax=Clupea harengus TaxID=7950 RepID=A0A6P3W1E0_CLUHA|nr:RWD domain-containing protein 2B isoform X3 [Clupea harengus]